MVERKEYPYIGNWRGSTIQTTFRKRGKVSNALRVGRGYSSGTERKEKKYFLPYPAVAVPLVGYRKKKKKIHAFGFSTGNCADPRECSHFHHSTRWPVFL